MNARDRWQMPLAVLLSVLWAAGCQQRVNLPADQAAAYAAKVDPIVENMLAGLNAKDYPTHSRDFDEELLTASDEVTFPQVYDEIIGKLGLYQSKALNRVETDGIFNAVIYDAVFEREDQVVMRVVFRVSDQDHHISGLWFDSPLLRGQK
jgi:hypothetical protein